MTGHPLKEPCVTGNPAPDSSEEIRDDLPQDTQHVTTKVTIIESRHIPFDRVPDSAKGFL